MRKLCKKCGKEREEEFFLSNKRKTVITCKICRDKNNAREALIRKGEKTERALHWEKLEQAYKNGNLICKTCKKEKPLSEFGFRSSKDKYNKSRYCKSCLSEETKWSKVRKYKISKEEFLKMLELQEYSCAICKNPITHREKFHNRNKSACIDHCHETKKVRGLLCMYCNRGIGLLKDNPEILRNAANYIEKYGKNKLLGYNEDVHS